MTDRSAKPPIAVIGVGALFPGNPAPDGFWRDIVAGRDCIGEVPPSHWLLKDYYDPDPAKPGMTYARRGGFIAPVAFDPIDAGIPPKVLPSIDTAQLLALIVARRALADARTLGFEHIDRKRTSVILGVASSTELVSTMSGSLQRPVWAKVLRESGLPEDRVTAICDRMQAHYVDWTENTFPGLLGNVVAGRIANRFDLGGTNCVIDAACASSLGALQMSMQELWNGDADMALTGGVDALNDIFMYMCFSKTPAMSPTGDCRPFSADADGTMLGEGIGMFALRRLADAERDGDPIYAVISGIGSSSDGRAKSIYAPRAQGQEQALDRAYQAAGYGPDTVELLEAHGTGTGAGDAAEVEALQTVFKRSGRTGQGWCAMGSVKSQIGHTKAAAGAASLYKAVLSLHHKVLPPTIKISAPNPALGLVDSPFRLNTSARPWIGHSRYPRRASVSSFGFGGSNFHVTLEEYNGPGQRPFHIRSLSSELFLIGAASAQALLERAKTVAADIGSQGFPAAARLTQTTIKADAPYRLALVATDAADLAAKIEVARTRLMQAGHTPFWLPAGIAFGRGERPSGKVAFLFPGQGSHYVGMGADLPMAFERSRRIWDTANAATQAPDGSTLAQDVFPPRALTTDERTAQNDRLTATDRAQLAIGVTSQVLFDLVTAAGIVPDLCAGHSFGELTALYSADVLSASAFLEAAAHRGRLMADVARSHPGAMLAISASSAEVRDLLPQNAPDIVIANINGPEQVVVAGPAAAIDAFAQHLATLGKPVRRLGVATAFHSPIVAPAVAPYATVLDGLAFGKPRIPVFANTTAAAYPEDPDAMRALLAGQLAKPVRFAEQIAALYDSGARVFVEVGPRSVLTDLTVRCLQDKDHLAIAMSSGGDRGVFDVWSALARLSAAGFPVDTSFAWDGYSTETTAAAPKSAVSVDITGANYGKVYPGRIDQRPPPPDFAAEARRAPVSPIEPVRPPPAPVLTKPLAAVLTTAPVERAPKSGSVHAPQANLQRSPLPIDGMPMPHADDAWLNALQSMQQHASDAHATAQRSMADAHIAYLKATEAAFSQLRDIALHGTEASGTVRSTLPIDPPARLPVAPVAVKSVLAQTVSQRDPKPPVAPVRVVAAASNPVQSAPRPSAKSLEDLVLSVVAEKTGYPLDILGLDMDLEADLGIDSIKRVEILSVVAAGRPDLPAIDTQALGGLRTLGAILDHLRAAEASLSPADSKQRVAEAAPLAASAPVSSQSLEDLVLSVVAEKTGYPRDILGLDMDLEADLGIDSIKRVEILSVVAAARPDLPAIDTQALGGLRTLGAILDHLRAAEHSLSSCSTPRVADPAPVAASAPASGQSLEDLMLSVVAEKTGYPRDILGLDMDLEADLGIDSIKRVEILSVVATARPDLPPIDTQALGGLRTLGAILEHLGVADIGTTPVQAVAALNEGVFKVARRGLREVLAPVINGAGDVRPGHVGKIAIIDSGNELGPMLADRLQTQGIEAEVMSDVPPDADGVLIIDSAARPGEDSALNSARRSFMAAQAFAAMAVKHGGIFVTVQDSGGDFGLSGQANGNAWRAGAPGLIKTLAREWPRATLKAIDLERDGQRPADLADTLAKEFLGGGKGEVGLRADGRRTTLEEFDLPVAGTFDLSILGERPVLVATGGARGVTAACLIALAEVKPLRLLLIGRTPLEAEPSEASGLMDEASLKTALLAEARKRGEAVSPRDLADRSGCIVAGREVRETVARLEALGSEAVYVAADVVDPAAVAEAVSQARSLWGRIDGLLHGAGTLADKRVAEKSVQQFERVFSTKVLGLRALLAATEGDALRLICLFSSVAARYGNAGQADYAVANEVLNKVARAEAFRRGAGCHVRSLNWGPWDGGMVSPALRDHFAKQGVPVITLEDGAAAFVDELCHQGGTLAHVDVVLGSALPN